MRVTTRVSSTHRKHLAGLEVPATREESLRALARSHYPGIQALAGRFVRDEDYFVRMEALEIIRDCGGGKYVPRILPLLKDPEPLVRVSVLECLVSARSRKFSQKALRGLRDRSPIVRAYAAWAVGVLRPRTAVNTLKRALRRDRNPLVRAGLYESLCKLTADEVYFKGLVRLLRNKDSETRCFVANSLVGVAQGELRVQARAALSEGINREKVPSARACLQKCLSEISESMSNAG